MRLVSMGIDTGQPLIVKPGQKCWICRKVALVRTDNAYEILLSVLNKKLRQWEKKRILACDRCLESKLELRDCEVIGFGDGVRLVDFVSSDERVKSFATCTHIYQENL